MSEHSRDLEALLEDIRARVAHYKDGLLTAAEALEYIERDIKKHDEK